MTVQEVTVEPACRVKKTKSILVINPKGGVAKTTTVQNLIVAAVMDGFKVLGVDMDPQRSLSGWYQMRCARLPKDHQIDFDLAETEVPHWREAWEHAPNYDVVIVDTPPSVDGAMAAIYELTKTVDFILIPVSTTDIEIRIATAWMEQFQKRRLRNVRFLMTRIPDTRRLSYAAAQDVLSKHGLIMSTIIPSREDVARASNAGDAVVEYAGLKGQSEYAALWNNLKFEMNMMEVCDDGCA